MVAKITRKEIMVFDVLGMVCLLRKSADFKYYKVIQFTWQTWLKYIQQTTTWVQW